MVEGEKNKPGEAVKKAASRKEKSDERLWLVTHSPHIHGGESVPRIMHSVIGALLPAAAVGVFVFGWPALFVMVLGVVSAVAAEAVSQKVMGRPIAVSDGSAALAGLLLAMTLPPTSPWWLVVVGGAFAIIFGKMVYGGLGYNIFNPALISRTFLLIAFPQQMTNWTAPRPLFGGAAIDAATGATPLGAIQEAVLKHGRIVGEPAAYGDLGLGMIGGSLGEISALALLVGAIYLLYKGYITWHIPASFIGTVFILTGVVHLVNPDVYADPVFHVLAGGLILGAFFMATDMVTCPMSAKGQLIFGAGCGVLTAVIRLWAGYPEGVAFAIVLMNATVPLIDRWTVPGWFGLAQSKAAAEKEASA